MRIVACQVGEGVVGCGVYETFDADSDAGRGHGGRGAGGG